MIAHKKFYFFIVGVIILLCMIIPVSASPSLEDASITYSVRVSISKYFISPSYLLNNTSLNSSGQPFSASGYTSYVNVPCSSGGTVFYLGSFSLNPFPFGSLYFFDSSNNIIASYSNSNFIVVPDNAVSFSVARYHGSSSYSCVYYPYAELNSSNYSRYIYDPVSSISFTDGKISIPYQAYSYISVFVDLEFFSNSYYLSNFGLDIFTYFSSSLDHLNGAVNTYLDENVLQLYMYHFDHGEKQFVFVDDSISNPTSFVESFDSKQPFSGFRLYIPVSYNDVLGSVSTSLQIELSNFYVDSKEALYESELENLVDDKQEQVSGVISDLTLPTPNIDDAFSGLDDLSTAYHNSEIELVSTFHILYDSFPIIVLFMTLSISMTVLGYILFGKSG